MVVGTRAHELALCAVYDSPLRCLCDLPRVYRDKPGLEFLRALPAAWDDTIALDGQIGEYYVVARRSGDDWRVSAITNEQAREIEIDRAFLGNEGVYDVTVYADSADSDKDANAIEIFQTTVDLASPELPQTFKVRLARDGGWNAVLRKR